MSQQTTTPTEVRELFSAYGKRAEIRWDELVAWFTVMLRVERDAAFEVGREMCLRLLRDIQVIQAADVIIQDNLGLSSVSVSSDNVLALARSTRRLAVRQPDVILAGLEHEAGNVLSSLLEGGQRGERVAALVAAGTSIKTAWLDFVAVAEGAGAWLETLETLPTVDVAYLANVVARTLVQRSWDLDQKDERRPVTVSAAAALVLARLLRRSPVPVDVVDTLTFQPTGDCDPATATGQKSGPYRVVYDDTNVLSASAGINQVDSVTMPDAKLEDEFQLALTRTDGYYHFSLAPGVYTVDMAAAVDPPVTLSITLSILNQFPNMSVVTPATVANAINTAQLPGVTAAAYQPPGYTYANTVKISLAAPVSGPSGWVRFSNPSDDELWTVLGLPSLHLTTQSMTAGEIANVYNANARYTTARSSRLDLLSGEASMLSETEVGVQKGVGYVTVSGATVTMGNVMTGSPWSLIAVGDECVLYDISKAEYSIHEVLTVDANAGTFTIDGTPIALPDVATINPVLPDGYDPAIGLTLDVGTRQYSFTASAWTHGSQPEMLMARVVDLSTQGHYESTASFSFQVYQEVLTLSSKDETTVSEITVSVTSLGSETAMPAPTRRATAYKTLGSFTRIEGHRNLVRVGDTVEVGNGATTVTEVDDGVLTVLPGIGITAVAPTLTIRNPHRAAWVTLVDTISSSVSTVSDADLYELEAVLSLLRTRPSDEAADRLADASSSVLGIVTQLEPAVTAFTEREMSTRAMKAILRAFRSISAWNFHEKITKGQLDALRDDPRDATKEGYAARLGSTTGQGIRTDLTPLERYVIGSIGYAGRG